MPVPDNKKYLPWNDPGGNTTITVIRVTWGAHSGEHVTLMPSPGKVGQGAGRQGREPGGGLGSFAHDPSLAQPGTMWPEPRGVAAIGIRESKTAGENEPIIFLS